MCSGCSKYFLFAAWRNYHTEDLLTKIAFSVEAYYTSPAFVALIPLDRQALDGQWPRMGDFFFTLQRKL